MGREALDEAAFLGEHRLLARVRRLAVRVAERPLAFVEVVVPRVQRDLAVVDLGDLRHDAVHELPIVRRHQQRAGPGRQELLQPDDRLDVQVVRRLVHQQHVGVAQQHARHGHAHLPAPRQRPHVAVDPVVVESQAVQHFAGLRLQRVPAEVVVLLLHLAEAGEDPIHVAGAGRVGHRVLKALEFVVQRPHAPAARDGLVEDRSARHLFHVLAEVPDGRPLRHADAALVGFLFTGDHPEQRGLARAVRPDQADFLAGIELEGRVDEQQLPAVLLRDGVERDHAGRPSVSQWIHATCALDRGRAAA